MKKQAWMVLSVAGLFLLFGASAGLAGSLEFRASIPFDFMAGNKMFPAGTYSVSNPGWSQSVLLIQNREPGHGSSAIVRTNAVEPVKGKPGKTQIIFNRYGDQYFLHQVWTAGKSGGHVLLMSSHERELAAKGARESEVVSLSASAE